MVDNQNIERRELFGHPVGLYVLFFAELWERFSYYGMRAILVLYMTSAVAGGNAGLGWAEGNALALYGWYTMLVYLMSIPGGILADKFIGQKRSVLIGGLILVAGHGILAVDAIWAFYTGLLLIVIGVGGLKPNISTMVGGLYPAEDERRDKGFTIFYIGINIGAFLASLIVGAIGETIGWHYGFGLAGIGMLLGQIVFMAGQRYLKGIGDPPSRKSKILESKTHTESIMEAEDESGNTSLGKLFSNLFKSPLHLGITAVLFIGGIVLGYSWFEGYEKAAYAALFAFLAICAGMLMMIYKDINKIEKDRFVVLLLSFLIVIVFWGAFEQAGGLMNIYTKQKINRLVSLNVLDIVFFGIGGLLLIKGIIDFIRKKKAAAFISALGVVVLITYFIVRTYILTDPYLVPASIFQSVNPLFIIIFGTLVASFWLWWQHRGKENSSLFKMAIGTIIMGVGFTLMGVASTQAAGGYGEKGMLILLILAYLLHTLGELSASPVALSFITKVAPVKYVSIMMGMYFAATGLGNKVAGTIGEASQAEPIKIEVAASADNLLPFIDRSETLEAGAVDSTFIKQEGFVILADLNVRNGEISLTQNGSPVNDLITLDSAATAEITERAEGEDMPLTAVLKFDKEKDAPKGAAPADSYSGQFEIYELQNRREFRTFIGIFIFTLLFGVILLVFLRKLKKLTHGADDTRPVHKEQQEKFELGDTSLDE